MRTNTTTGRAGTAQTHLRREVRARHRTAAAIALVATLGFAACGSDDDSAPTAALDDRAIAATGESIESDSAPADVAREAPATGGTSQTGAPIDFTFGRDLIVEAGVTMLTPNVRDAVDDIIRISRDNGGAVFNANVTVEDPLEDGSIPGGGTIVIRIPPTQLDRLIEDLKGVGTLRNQTQSVDDVTDQLIDLDIQIRQAFESVERMEAILAETTDFDSLVAAETELVRRQTAYERLLAAQRNIDDRVALSTLTVTVHYQSPTVDEPVTDDGDKGIGEAFSDGWNAFVGLMFGVAFVLAVSAPFLAIALVVLLLGWLITKRMRRRHEIERNRHEPIDPLPAPANAAAAAVTAADADDLVDASPQE